MKVLEQIISLFTQSDVLIVGDSPLLRKNCVTVSKATGSPDNEVVCISWEQGEIKYLIAFTEQGLQEGKWKNGMFCANDHEGDEIVVCFYSLQPKLLGAPDRSLLSQVEDCILDVANSYDELTTSDLQGFASAKAREICNIVQNHK